MHGRGRQGRPAGRRPAVYATTFDRVSGTRYILVQNCGGFCGCYGCSSSCLLVEQCIRRILTVSETMFLRILMYE